ncbi:PhzF family phenazine biosynthesis protein [Falsibacillus albus]|uniref:PhzF family phenazine biosynthesis protein n=1 Tax=Falsibacillus albus TaxID=2478915 RepID=A0A3L7JVJ9_9BACI|nr:PhzF family phenazine biosynthesis protein [Falsibacillus albus]RLQ94274.1 PhzF family phenazine biosynthesis protein [Falsibacillus albus]
MQVYQYDAFSNTPNKGNPAGVVFRADGLSEKEMQETANKAGFNETAFLLKSENADLRIRYFSPGTEMDLCGHATVASIYALFARNEFAEQKSILIETKAGILPIYIQALPGGDVQITMQQATPDFREFNGSLSELAASIGLTKEDIDDQLPVLYGSTGTWTLLIPIKSLEAFKKMEPKNQLFPSILKEMPRASVHPFCLDAYDASADMHGRHFSSAYSGVVEDPVTGTASGVMGAYYAQFVKPQRKDQLEIVVEQGDEMNKDGRVMVRVINKDEQYEVEISGSAVYVGEKHISLDGKKA